MPHVRRLGGLALKASVLPGCIPTVRRMFGVLWKCLKDLLGGLALDQFRPLNSAVCLNLHVLCERGERFRKRERTECLEADCRSLSCAKSLFAEGLSCLEVQYTVFTCFRLTRLVMLCLALLSQAKTTMVRLVMPWSTFLWQRRM